METNLQRIAQGRTDVFDAVDVETFIVKGLAKRCKTT